MSRLSASIILKKKRNYTKAKQEKKLKKSSDSYFYHRLRWKIVFRIYHVHIGNIIPLLTFIDIFKIVFLLYFQNVIVDIFS